VFGDQIEEWLRPELYRASEGHAALADVLAAAEAAVPGSPAGDARPEGLRDVGAAGRRDRLRSPRQGRHTARRRRRPDGARTPLPRLDGRGAVAAGRQRDDQLRDDWSFPLHTGDVLGDVSRVAWLGLAASPPVLLATGLTMWLARWSKRRRRRERVTSGA
jgi:uncharacterized iron-regulated membrane protein